MNKITMAMNMSIALLQGCEKGPELRLKKNAFTRNRKLGTKRILHILLHRLSGPLQPELDTYYDTLEEIPMSKQAFSQAGANLNPEFIQKFADRLAEIYAQDPDAPTWNAMRLIAIDGTDIALENSTELKQAFGCSGRKKDAATALGSLAYGSLDHAIYDCQIALCAADERDLAKLYMFRLLLLFE